jgi:hypothetical protein
VTGMAPNTALKRKAHSAGSALMHGSVPEGRRSICILGRKGEGPWT